MCVDDRSLFSRSWVIRAYEKRVAWTHQKSIKRNCKRIINANGEFSDAFFFCRSKFEQSDFDFDLWQTIQEFEVNWFLPCLIAGVRRISEHGKEILLQHKMSTRRIFTRFNKCSQYRSRLPRSTWWTTTILRSASIREFQNSFIGEHKHESRNLSDKCLKSIAGWTSEREIRR